MAQYYDSNTRAFPVAAGTALGRYTRVKLSAGSLGLAGAGEAGLGILRDAALSSGATDGEPKAVLLWSKPGTFPMVANGAITAGALVYSGASGKAAAAGIQAIGRALNAATADGDIIEVLVNGANAIG